MFTSKEQAAGYLAGMIDGEGTVTKTRTRVRIYNTDLDLIDAVEQALALLDISSYGKRIIRHDNPKHADLHEIEVWGVEALQKILVTPLHSSAKVSRIQEGARDRRLDGNGSRRCVLGCTCRRHSWRNE